MRGFKRRSVGCDIIKAGDTFCCGISVKMGKKKVFYRDSVQLVGTSYLRPVSENHLLALGSSGPSAGSVAPSPQVVNLCFRRSYFPACCDGGWGGAPRAASRGG